MSRPVFSPGSQLPSQPASMKLAFFVTKASSELVTTLRLCSGVVWESTNWPEPKASLS